MKRVLALFLLLAVPAYGQQKPFAELVGDVKVGPVASGPTQVGFLTWGGDVATFVANGGLTTKPDSIYGKAGLNLKLVNGDDFVQQVRDYLSGKTPYLRGTTHMLALANEIISKDPRTKPHMFLQLTFSKGDHIVARDTVKTLNDLKGKKIVLQGPGPHLGLLDDSLRAAGMKLSDVTVVWVPNLTGPKDSPAALFRSDPSIDACCVITPDMIGLCSGLDQVGSGAEGTVKGSHVVNSTAQMSRSIADCYYVRDDFLKSHRDQVEAFTVGYLKATEELLAEQALYKDGTGQSPKYVAALTLAQQIYGKEVLPTIETDAHGLVLDAAFVRVPGNEVFFQDPNNLTGFTAKESNGLDMALALGWVASKVTANKVDWDYKDLSQKVGVKYVEPVYATGRLKAEVADFGADLDSSTIFSFEIKFEPEQNTFPLEQYAADFKRFCESSALFSNAAIVIEGHADPTLSLQHFVWAAKAKGLLTGTDGNYSFKGQPLNLADTATIVAAIQGESLAGQKRVDRSGRQVEVPDPKQTVAATLTLSRSRAEAVRKAIEEFAAKNKYQVDMSQAVPSGVGIASPVVPRPRSLAEAKENMRVVFRVVRVNAEALKADDFDFDK